jgi:4-diphosphocytidyl-2-C-methyl-D-erythritol kinase
VTLVNDLQAPVAARHPQIIEIIEALLGAGAMAAAMTGSGSAVFGLFAGRVTEAVVARLRRPDWLILPTRTCTRREAGRLVGL